MTATNTVPAPAVTVSAVSQLAGKVVHLALNLVSTLAILRYLAPDAYGSYVLVVTMVTLVGVVADFGLPKLAVREIALSDSVGLGARNEILGTLVVLRLVLAVVAIVGCQVLLALFAQPTLVHQAAAIASLTLLVDAVLGIIVVCFQVHLVQQYEAVVRVAAEGLETGLVLLLIALHVSFLGLFVPPIVGLVVGLGLAFALGRRFQLRLTPGSASARSAGPRGAAGRTGAADLGGLRQGRHPGARRRCGRRPTSGSTDRPINRSSTCSSAAQ